MYYHFEQPTHRPVREPRVEDFAKTVAAKVENEKRERKERQQYVARMLQICEKELENE